MAAILSLADAPDKTLFDRAQAADRDAFGPLVERPYD